MANLSSVVAVRGRGLLAFPPACLRGGGGRGGGRLLLHTRGHAGRGADWEVAGAAGGCSAQPLRMCASGAAAGVRQVKEALRREADGGPKLPGLGSSDEDEDEDYGEEVCSQPSQPAARLRRLVWRGGRAHVSCIARCGSPGCPRASVLREGIHTVLCVAGCAGAIREGDRRVLLRGVFDLRADDDWTRQGACI
jgi:hypothetical protein